ncbi:MAG: methyltransferase domain-containing protein [Planctomycetes bacterium]|nr:methyltransferase domain-containing protein [Planctomycetota bacterium]
MIARRGDWSGTLACDLGCGLGLGGIVLGRRGASVTFVDRERDALAFAAWNAGLSPPGCAPETACLDWTREELEGRFDLILLADVSYRGDAHEGLLRQLRRCLRPGGLALHADPLREESTRFLRLVQRDFVTATSRATITVDGEETMVRAACMAREESSLRQWLEAPWLAGGLLERPWQEGCTG